MPMPPLLPIRDLLVRLWDCPKPRGLVLLVHGLGAQSLRWSDWAEAMSAQGFVSAALELRGFGESPGPRGDVASFLQYYTDIDTLAGELASRYPGVPLFLAGESMGGLLAFRSAARHPAPWTGVLLISPAFGNTLKFPWHTYLRSALGLIVQPGPTLDLPFSVDMFTTDPSWQDRLRDDPRELRQASSRLMLGIVAEQGRVSRDARAWHLPVLFQCAGQDLFVSVPAARRVYDRLPVADKTWTVYPGLRHALTIERGREQVFADAAAWLQRRLSLGRDPGH